MEDQEIQIERYKIAVEQVRWEGNLGWDNFRTFLIVHTIFIGFLLKGVFERQDTYSVGSFFIALIGILLCIPWVATKIRNDSYYRFRMAQARELEPDDWSYFKGKGKDFSDGKTVEIQGKPYKIRKLGQVIKKPLATTIIIRTFLVIYILIAISSCINMETVFLLKIISIALTVLCIFFITFALKKIKQKKKNLIAPSFANQIPFLIIVGLIMIIISACIQLAIVMWK